MHALLFSKNDILKTTLAKLLKSRNIKLRSTRDQSEIPHLMHDPECLALFLDLPYPEMDDLLYWRWLLRTTPIPVLIFSSDHKLKFTPYLTRSITDLILGLQKVKELEGNQLIHFFELSPNLILDVANVCIRMPNKTVPLSTTEFKLLYLLATHPGKAFSTEELMDHLDLVESSSLYMTVKRIREKIEADPKHPSILIYSRGKGYQLHT